MAEKTISIREAYKSGWETIKNNIRYFLKILAIILAFNFALGITIALGGGDENVLVTLVVNLINSIFSIVIAIGLIKIYVAFARGSRPQLSELFSNYQLFFKFLFSSILNGLIVGVGMLLFVVPGVIWGLMFSQFPYLVVDKKKGPIEALKESSRLTKGVKWELLGFFIIAFLINLLGLALFVVGVFLTSFITKLATAHVYQQLLDQEKSEGSETSTPTPAALSAPTSKPKPEA